MPDNVNEYIINHHHESRSTFKVLGLGRASFISSQEVFEDEEYADDALIRKWAHPNGYHHTVRTAISVPSGDFVFVNFQRRIGSPAFGADERAVLDGLRPHLARAGFLAARWRLERLEAKTEALEAIGLPAAVVDFTGRVLITHLGDAVGIEGVNISLAAGDEKDDDSR